MSEKLNDCEDCKRWEPKEIKIVCIYEPIYNDYPTSSFCNQYVDCSKCPYSVPKKR